MTTYLPPGRWMDWWSGAVHQGPQTLRRQVPLRELPLYLRENSLLVLGPVRSHVAERAGRPAHRGGVRHDGGDVRIAY